MGTIYYNNAVVTGNFSKLRKRRPKDWWKKDYKILIPYKFKWRMKVGKVECDCQMCEEHYQPYYGWTWYHLKECALIRHIDRHPGIANFWQFWDTNLRIIAQTD